MGRLAPAVALATARLDAGPHPERARLDAEALLFHVTGKNRAWLLAHGDDEFGGCTAINYAALVSRRLRGEPIQYITGTCEFYGLPLCVAPDVLIPRPETEHLVEKALALVNASGAPSVQRTYPDGADATNSASAPRILDIGTGSGAVAIALAHALPRAHVTAVDLSRAALTIAQSNAKLNGMGCRIRFLESDLLSAVQQEEFDIIVSNPPYVPEADRPTLAVEVREHEPALALFAGADGLDVYRRLIPDAARALTPGGWLILEIGHGQADDLRELLIAAGFAEPEFAPDLQGILRVASAKLQ